MSQDSIQLRMAQYFEEQAEWREDRAAEFPNDAFRNLRSARWLRELADWVRMLPYDDLPLLAIDSIQPPDLYCPAASTTKLISQFGFHQDETREGFPALIDLLLVEDSVEMQEHEEPEGA